MEGVEAVRSDKSSLIAADSEGVEKLKDRLERLLREAAEVEVELSRAKGTIKGVPHYSLIEGRAHELGKQLSRGVQERQMSELVAAQATTAKCPQCRTVCNLRVKKREVKSVDGETPLQELVGDCPCCRRSFFPSARGVGF
jgi:hypothetical protein